mgnify:FL=1
MLLSRISSALIAGLFVFNLGACGFEPIYAYKEIGYVRGELEHVSIKPIKDRIGQELKNNLLDILSPRGISDQSLWELSVTLTESTQKISLEQTSFSTRANLTVRATFKLKSLLEDSTQKFGGNANAISSYNILDSDYANLVAERDAHSRAVKSLANDIARQLALWMREDPDKTN